MFETLNTLWQDIISHPGASLAIIGNLIIIESLLSVDNAAVLATMVMDLPKEQREKALRYGIWGAYIFRGLAMVFAAVLIEIWWLKPLGGLYLLYLVYAQFKGKQTESEDDDLINKKGNWLYRATVGYLGVFWATVALVELMDMAFSIDNVFAAVAFSPNIILVFIGVFIGILAMRFVANSFVRLMEKYPFLETCAFIVIAVLGLKLISSLYGHYFPCSEFTFFMEGHNECYTSMGQEIPKGHAMVWGDILTSGLTIAIFVFPILYHRFFVSGKKEA